MVIIPVGVVFNRHGRVTVGEEHEIEQLARGAPIAPGERCDGVERQMGHNGFHNRMHRRGLHCCDKQPHIINRLRSNLPTLGWWRIKRGDLMQPFDQIHRKGRRFPCPQLRICPPVGDAFDHVQITATGVLWNVSVFKHKFNVRFRHAGAGNGGRMVDVPVRPFTPVRIHGLLFDAVPRPGSFKQQTGTTPKTYPSTVWNRSAPSHSSTRWRHPATRSGAVIANRANSHR